MLDKDKLLDVMREKLRKYQRERNATKCILSQEMIDGELKMLRHYLKEIESGQFDKETSHAAQN